MNEDIENSGTPEENTRGEGGASEANEPSDAPAAGPRLLPKGVFVGIAVGILFAFCIGGVLYYRGRILPERLYQTAARHMHSREYREAWQVYQRLVKIKPGHSDALYQMGIAQEMLGDDAGAIASYRARLAAHPDDVSALARMGGAYLHLGMYEEAKAAYERVAERYPDSPATLSALGEIYEKLGNPRQAAVRYTRLIELGSDDPELLISVSRALMRLGYYREALTGFEMASPHLVSGDKRAFHAINAAKNMMGWPTDAALVMVPGRSLGGIRLGAMSADVEAAWGKPAEQVAEGDHELWGYGARGRKPETLIFMEHGEVIEIRTTSIDYRTSDGLGVRNFMQPKFRARFDRWEDKAATPPRYRYILKGGGLAFYSGETPSAVVYREDAPLSEEIESEWVPIYGSEQEEEEDDGDTPQTDLEERG